MPRGNRTAAALAILPVFLALGLAAARAQEREESAAPAALAHIQDNSFLVEEAYNQDPGMVQHIMQYALTRDSGSWLGTFTQEWPVGGIRHQLSTTLAYARTDGGARGLGDFAINYRYQLVGDADAAVAVAPRFSLYLPFGDWRRDLGAGAYGLQVNVPVSTVFSPKWVAHWNAGATWTPSARDDTGDRANTAAWNLGASIIYTGSPIGDAMLETVYSRFQIVRGRHATSSDAFAFVSPGVRWAWDFPSGLQIVPGVALPVGFGPSGRTWQVLLYLSFEHPFTEIKK
jgi:hypothetical protein